ncbi:MAG: hypothetical protein IJZ34_10940 [Lachnospiraceae bacterium]|nr:hypothetical protein [Lachnospiraceae bacterium]
MKVKAIKRFHDVVAKKIREKDKDVWVVTKERGEHLIKQGMVEEVKEEPEKDTKTTKKG